MSGREQVGTRPLGCANHRQSADTIYGVGADSMSGIGADSISARALKLSALLPSKQGFRGAQKACGATLTGGPSSWRFTLRSQDLVLF